MIVFGDTDLYNESVNSVTKGEPFQEGLVKDSLDAAKNAVNKAGIDTDQIEDDWKNSDTKGKVKVAADTATAGAKVADKKLDRLERDNKIDSRSIVAQARNSVIQFPIYVTNSIRGTEAHILSKMFEKVYATLVQTRISQDTILDEEEANGLVFLKKYHTNIRESAEKLVNEYYEPIDEFDRMMQESVFNRVQLSESCTVEFSVVPTDDKRLITENARLMNEPLTGFPYLTEAVKDYVKKDNTPGDKSNDDLTVTSKHITLKDADLVDIARQRMDADDVKILDKTDAEINAEANAKYPLPSEPGSTASSTEKNQYKRDKQRAEDNRNKYIEDLTNDRSDAKDKLRAEVEKVKEEMRNGKLMSNTKGQGYYYDQKTGKYYRKEVQSTSKTKTPQATPVNKGPDVPQLLRTTDIKKINGMDPYQIKVTFLLRSKSGINTEVSYILGVKSVMHQIYAQDLADDLHELVTGNIRRLQKVRYKTGEIKFMDYMFNIKGLKADAARNIKGGKRWITTLKRLADYSRTNSALLKKPAELLRGGAKVPIPNGTLILSQTDVTMLVDKTGIDLSKVGNAKKLAKSLFLIGIAIVDPSDGTMRVMFDQDNDWDVQSLASVEADVAKTDNNTLVKELNKLVNH